MNHCRPHNFIFHESFAIFCKFTPVGHLMAAQTHTPHPWILQKLVILAGDYWPCLARLLQATARAFQSKAQVSFWTKSDLLITTKTMVRVSNRKNLLFLVSSLFLFRTDVLKPISPQLQLSELDVADSWEAPPAIRACIRGAKRLAMPLHLYSLSLPVGSSTHCHFWNKAEGNCMMFRLVL